MSRARSIQHWWRCWHGAPTDAKWPIIAKTAQSKAATVWALYSMMIDYASQARKRGSLSGFDLEVAAYAMQCELAEVTRIYRCFSDRGMVHDAVLVNWKRRQPKREDDRTRDRSSKKNKQDQDVDLWDDPQMPTNAHQEKTRTRGIENQKTHSRGSRWESGRQVPQEWIDEVPAIRARANKPPIDARLAADDFADYWSAATGRIAVKKDWHGTWRQWVRSPYRQTAGATPRGRTTGLDGPA